MSIARFYKALLDVESVGHERSLSPEALLRSILFSKEFFELHAPYLRRQKIADDEVLVRRVEMNVKKVTIGAGYVKDLATLNGDEFVRGVYRLFLDREPDEEGFEVYRKALEEFGKGYVLRAIVYSEEATRHNRDVIVLNEAHALINEL